MIGYQYGDRIECDDEPGYVIWATRDEALVRLDDGRSMIVDTRALDALSEIPDSADVLFDGVHEWRHA